MPPTLQSRTIQLENELSAVNNAIQQALGLPASVNASGGISYTNRTLPELYDTRDRIERMLAALRTGGTISRVSPVYCGGGSY